MHVHSTLKHVTICSVILAVMLRKKSLIWDYFVVTEDTKYAVCKTCNQLVSKGEKTTKTFNIFNLVYHPKLKHKEKYTEYTEKNSSVGASKGKSVLKVFQNC